MVMILAVCVRKIMASSVLVSSNFLMPTTFLAVFQISFLLLTNASFQAAELLRPDISTGEEVERLALAELIEVLLFRTSNPAKYKVTSAYNSMILFPVRSFQKKTNLDL
jgi:hypothetical protein